MTRDEFFKEAMFVFFRPFVKENKATLNWVDEYGVYTITLKTINNDYILRIYDGKIVFMTSHPAYPVWNSDLNFDVFAKHFDFVYKDKMPF